MQEMIDQLSAAIRAATERKNPLQIRGGGTKDFYGDSLTGQNHDRLDVTACAGVIEYEPADLVVTAGAGTRLAELEAVLSKNGQMLAFEPPHFGSAATLGGCVATGLSGPRRASAGAVRDFVLGVRMLDGRGNDLRFGGQVMKNVAGYDISRLMVGSMGTLGVLTEISLKILPLPPADLTLRMQLTEADAIEKMNGWAGKPLPVSATCFYQNELTVRLSGAEVAIRAAQAKIGGEEISNGKEFWKAVQEQTHGFFQKTKPLWRLSIHPTTPPLALPGLQLIEWNGALRWFVSDGSVDAETIRATAKNAGGHATLFRPDQTCVSVFHPLEPNMMKLHRLLKQQFDPAGIFNPGRLYPDL
ncbi:MAG: glycolate oxidase subunit GlcE [Nitrosomonas sp.]|nr:MAG: glycolate oxidase subunit GlcE [Nitrosomonas sp.]